MLDPNPIVILMWLEEYVVMSICIADNGEYKRLQ
jgi:hypothetical protein